MNDVFGAVHAAVQTVENNPVLNISIFAAFVAVTLFIVIRASRNNKTAADYYAAGRSFTGPQNGFAISGDYLSAASFLGITGAIAINGYDGFLYSIGFLVAWLVALLLVAELMRNTGKFTMADVLSFRLKQGPVRMAAAITTLAVCFFYLLAQMAGAGGLVSLLLGIKETLGQSLVVAVVGVLMIVYVLVGGMKGTTWVQIVKAFLLIGGALVMTIWVLAINGFSLNTLLESAVAASITEQKDAILGPGLQYGKNPWDFISLAIALVLGTAGLPHVLMRFYTVPTAKEARRSVVWAIWLIGVFYLFTLVLGYGAGSLVGPEAIKAAPGGVNSAAPLLALALGGPLLLGFISAVAFATILAVVAGLTITAAASFAHDIYAERREEGERAARRRGQGRPPHGARDRRARHPRRHRRAGPERGVPGGAGLRGRRLGEPADDPVLAVLAAVQHAGRRLEHVRGTGRGHHPHRAVAGLLGHRDQRVQEHGHGHLAAEQPGHRLDPRGLPARLARLAPVASAGGSAHGGRDGRPLAHRLRRGEGDRPLGRRLRMTCAPADPAGAHVCDAPAAYTPASRSRSSRKRFTSGWPPYSPMLPSARTTRCTGTTMEKGVRAHAVPTARAARGVPASTATSP